MLARRRVAPHMEQFDQAGDPPPFPLRGDHRRPAMLVIFVAPQAAAVTRVKQIRARRNADFANLMREQRESRAEAIIDPPTAIHLISHTGSALQCLSLER